MEIPYSLSREFKALTFTSLILLIVFTMLFLTAWPTGAGLQWFLQASFIWTLIIFRTSNLLGLNHASNQTIIYSNLGWANLLTMLRGFLIAITGGFIFQDNLNEKILLIPALSYFFAAIIDRVDGFVARKTQHESLLGTKLDTELDALGLLIAPLLAVWTGQIHWSYLSVSLAYYFFQWGIYWRLKHGKPVYELPINMSRRAVAGFQMGFLAVVLWPILEPPATKVAGIAFMLPLLAGFIIDWATVSGLMKSRKSEKYNFLQTLLKLAQGFLLPAIRLLIMLLLCLSLIRINPEPLFSDGGLYTTYPILVSSLLISSLMILLGICGRFFAVILSCLLAWFYISFEMQLLDSLLLIIIIWIMQFGTGKFSLWIWDDLWVNRYDGANA